MPPRKLSAAAKGPASIAEGLPRENKREAMALILDRLENLTDKSGRSVSELFMELPDREDYPDYYMIIQHPIALDIIKGRLETGEYKDEDLARFGKDLKTLTANAKTYNREGSMVYRDATTLESYINVAIDALAGSGSQASKREEFSTDFCRRVLDTIKSHEDKDGRQMAELFMELPSEEDYPDYYEEIKHPIAIENIEDKINRNAFQTLEAFEKDMNLMFENAKLYNAEGSDVYLDAEELQHLFWKTIGKNGRGRQTKGKRARKHDKELPEVVHKGETYKVGDFVHIQNDVEPSKPIIGLIFSLWEDENGVKGLDAVWFLRPENIVHPYASRFYPSEVVKASGVHAHLVEDVVERCFVLQTKDYIRGRPHNWKEGLSIYVCEQRYNESYKSVTKIKNWASCLPPGHKPADIELVTYPQPLSIKKNPSASMVDKAGRQDTSEPASRAGTPEDTPASSPSWSQEAETKPAAKTTKSKKRKSAQLYPEPPFQPAKPEVVETGEQQARQPTPHYLAQQASPAARQHRPASPSVPRFRCNFSNLDTKKQCASVFSSEMDLQKHVANEHANVVSQATAVRAQKRGRPKKASTTASAPDTASPPTPTAAQPVAPTVMGQSAHPSTQSAYNSYPSAYSAHARPRPAAPSPDASGLPMYSGAGPYQHTQQQMHYMQQPSQQRGVPSYPQAYSQLPVHSGQVRSQGYSSSATYGQGYGQQYGMSQHPPHQAYAYGQSPPQYQQGFSSQGYPTQHQGAYAQSYPTSHHAYSQQQQPQHYGQQYASPSPQQHQQHRHLPPPTSSQNHMDHQQQLMAHQQQVVQQQRLAQQQQQMVQQQYLQQQLAQTLPQAHPGYHQRSLSQTQGAYANQHQQQQQQQQPQSPVSVVASQSLSNASTTSAYQPQPYLPPTSISFYSSGHSATLSNASTHSHGSVSTVTNALEGVGLGLSGVTNVDHGRIVMPTSTPDAFASTATSIGYGSKGVSAPVAAVSAPSKPSHSDDYMAAKRMRLDSGLQPGGHSEYENNSFIGGGMTTAEGPRGSTMGNNGSSTAAITDNNGQHINGVGNGNGTAPVVLPGINALTDPLNRGTNVEIGQ
ncbi:hypothetical protein BGZ75_009428 [Mortierella antarctica]|nr:hypothetical protein BGZ75_009428 [Mortierella antarctica]